MTSNIKQRIERIRRGELLQNFGAVKREVADALAISEYEKYDAHRRMLEAADVDVLINEVRKMKP